MITLAGTYPAQTHHPPLALSTDARTERHAQVVDFEARRQWRVYRRGYAAMAAAMAADARPVRRHLGLPAWPESGGDAR